MGQAADQAGPPLDDLPRALVVTNLTDAQHIALARDDDAILVTGAQTNRCRLIEMLAPPGGGPRPERPGFLSAEELAWARRPAPQYRTEHL